MPKSLSTTDYETFFAIKTLLSGIAERSTKEQLTGDTIHRHGRLIGTLVFEMSTVYSGYTSKAALLAKKADPDFKPTAEHMNPRQVSGNKIVNAVIEDGAVHDEKLMSMLNVARRVNRVTSAENRALMPFQKVHKFVDAETAYAAASIELYQWPNYKRITKLKETYPEIC